MGSQTSSRKSWLHEGSTAGPEGQLESLCFPSSLPVIRSVALSLKCTLRYLFSDIAIVILWSVSLLERAQPLRVQGQGHSQGLWSLRVGVRIAASLCQRHSCFLVHPPRSLHVVRPFHTNLSPSKGPALQKPPPPGLSAAPTTPVPSRSLECSS